MPPMLDESRDDDFRIAVGSKANEPRIVFEVLALPVYGGSAAYLAWLEQATKRDA